MNVRQYQVKLNNNLTPTNFVQTSKFYEPEFYDKNELKEIFKTYEDVLDKVESPVELKKN